ncbi:MAG: preprotein translocase subunit YajC [Spirochaetales bacterium]|nr:preprotein translocase subunit YajC [Spirochaetales bacterium]
MIDLLLNLPVLQAAEGGDSTTNLIWTIAPIGLIIVVFYFLIIRPQNKKQKELQNMLGALKKGDKIVTIGGIYGTVTAVKEQSVVVKVDTDTTMEFTKNAVSQVLTDKDKEEGKSSGKKKSSN